MALEKLPIDGDTGTGSGSTGTGTTPVTPTKTTEPLAFYQDKRFLLGVAVFIVIVWFAATFLA